MTVARVALIHHGHSSAAPSGEDAVVAAEAAALRAHNIEVAVFGPHVAPRDSGPIEKARFASRAALGVGGSALSGLPAFRPDIVHVHNTFPGIGRRSVAALPHPLVVTLHSFRPACPSGWLYRDGHDCWDCVDGNRFSAVRHRCLDGSLAGSAVAAIPPNSVQRDPVLRKAAALIVMAEPSVGHWVRLGLDEARIRLLPHFLPDDLDPGAIDEHARGEGWLSVGRLSHEKGILELLDRWPADEPLDIVGSGPLEDEVRRRCAGTRWQFLGPLTRREVLREMDRHGGLVFASRYRETFGLTAMEALASSLPILAFEGSVVAEAVEEHGAGAVVSWQEPLRDRLPRARREFLNLRTRARVIFEEQFAEKAHMKRRLALYEQVLHHST